MNQSVSLLAWMTVSWVTIQCGLGMTGGGRGGQSEIQLAPSTPPASPSRETSYYRRPGATSPKRASRASSPAPSLNPFSWWKNRQLKKKQEKEEKEKAAAKRKKPVRKPGPPIIIWGTLDNITVGAWIQMVGSMKTNDVCNDKKYDAGQAKEYCKRVTGLLDRLPPWTRSKACPRVTNGKCVKQNGGKICVVDTYTKEPYCSGFLNYKKIEKTNQPFTVCLGLLSIVKPLEGLDENDNFDPAAGVSGSGNDNEQGSKHKAGADAPNTSEKSVMAPKK